MKRHPFANRAEARCIYGVHAVEEWLRLQPDRVRVLYVAAAAAPRAAGVATAAAQAGVSVEDASEQRLTALAGTVRHQGVVALMAPFAYADLHVVLRRRPRLLIAADQVQDPHNLGALLRTAAAAGAGAVIVPRVGAVGVTPTVEAGAAGAAARVPVCRITNMARTLAALKKEAYWSVGLLPRGGVDLYAFDPPDHVILVTGGEIGMRALVERHCDWAVSIPMAGQVESLNLSVAVALASYEVRRRWQAAGKLDSTKGVV